MFYLETKDGEKFLTDIHSNDVNEFQNILESKLGKEAEEIFTSLLLQERGYNESIIEDAYCRLKACADDLEHTLDTARGVEEPTMRSLSDLLCKINAICNILNQ